MHLNVLNSVTSGARTPKLKQMPEQRKWKNMARMNGATAGPKSLKTLQNSRLSRIRSSKVPSGTADL